MSEHRIQFPDDPSESESTPTSKLPQRYTSENRLHPLSEQNNNDDQATAQSEHNYYNASHQVDGVPPPPETEKDNTHFYFEEGEEGEFELDEDEDEDNGIIMKDKSEAVAIAIAENGLPSPPDGGWGWVIVAASFMCFLVIDGCTSAFGILLPDIVDEFSKTDSSIGRSQVAWAGSLLGGFSLCIGPIVSALTNKFGCRCISMTGSIFAAAGFVGASYSPNLSILLLTYGVIGGIGVGLLYLPAIVCVGYYFESKRSLATGIALSGSGIGAIAFAPIITALSDVADWRMVCLGFAGLMIFLSIAGALMRPLEIVIEPVDSDQAKDIPLLQRMANDKKRFMENSYAGTDFFMVQLPDGSKEKRPKLALNVDPGVNSVLYLDQLAPESSPIPPHTSTIAPLPTIKETKPLITQDNDLSMRIENTGAVNGEAKSFTNRLQPHRTIEKEVSHHEGIPASLPGAFRHDGDSFHTRMRATSTATDISQHSRRERRHSEGCQSPSKGGVSPAPGFVPPPKNIADIPKGGVVQPKLLKRDGSSFTSKGSEPLFSNDSMAMSSKETGIAGDGTSMISHTPRERRYSIKAIPSTSSFGHRKNSYESSHHKSSVSNFRDSRRDILDEDYKLLLSTSEFNTNPFMRKLSLDHRKSSVATTIAHEGQDATKFIIRPMSRKDIFYSGSIQHLPEYQSQDLSGYHQSILNIAHKGKPDDAYHKPIICPCISQRAGAFKTALAQMVDCSLIRNPIFIAIGMSAVFGMLGFFVPLVYVIDFSREKGISKESAAAYLSLIGITSTVGRLIFGYLSDFPWVNSLFVYNCCILTMGISTFVLPFISDYYFIALMYTCFGTGLSGFIALSSIVLVELLGLENLTNAFGLLIFFRGISSVLGTPLSGAIYDKTKAFDMPFWLAGVFLIISAGISFMIPLISRYAPPKHVMESRKQSLGPLEDILEEPIESCSDKASDEKDKKHGNGHAVNANGNVQNNNTQNNGHIPV